MKLYNVTLTFVDYVQNVKLLEYNPRFLQSVLDKMFLEREFLIKVSFSTCSGFYEKSRDKAWEYKRK